MLHSYGLKKDLFDSRDVWAKRGESPFFAVSVLPKSADLRPFCTPVEDQENYNSCTANAIVGAMEYLTNRKTGGYVDLSRFFLYRGERALEGTLNKDEGAYIRDGIKVAASLGVCLESLFPYTRYSLFAVPSDAALQDAKGRRIMEYARLTNNGDDIKTVLASGFPIVIGLQLFESFETDAVTRSGDVPMPEPRSEKWLGGHAVLIVGYDENSYIIRNSWGRGWGEAGYCRVPHAYIESPDLCSDMWAVRA